MLIHLWFNVLIMWRRTSLPQWLLGLLMVAMTGLLLYKVPHVKPDANDRLATDSYLRVAGSDLKFSEMLSHEMKARPEGCKNGIVSR